MVLIIGPSGSGKSLAAEQLACSLQAQDGLGGLLYLATFVPADDDGQQRIERHRRQRAGLGFTTIESPQADIGDAPADVVLLEDVSNLLANSMFADHDPAPVTVTLRRIDGLRSACRHLVVVSIGGLAPSPSFDAGTLAYIDALDQVNVALRESADQVIDISKARA